MLTGYRCSVAQYDRATTREETAMRKTVVTVSIAAGLAAPLFFAPSATAGSFPRKAVQDAIESQIKEVVKQKATVKCPARSSWTRGAVFFCNAKPTNGDAAYKVKVTLGREKTHAFRWLKVG
jgi:hypothetical protein